MDIKILGTGCPNCSKLYEMAEKVIKDLDIEAELSKVEQPMAILSMGVMRTPAIIIDRTVVHQGSVPSEGELKDMIKRAIDDK